MITGRYAGTSLWSSAVHQEVASGPFCLLVNSPWLLVFASLFYLLLMGLSLYCWKGIHFSWSLDILFVLVFLGLIITLHFWFRDLLRELNKKYEILLMVLFLVFFLFLASEALLFISFFWASFHSLSSPSLGVWPGEGFYVPDPCELTFANTLLLSNAAISLGGAFVSLEISSSSGIFFSLLSFLLAWTFISLQIKEFRIMGLSINDSIYSCVFFFLTGLHFFHLLLGVLLLGLFFWGCSFSVKVQYFVNLRISEIHLFYNLQLFYWHFLEILWLFIFLVLYFS
jgi:cytochrome c oxidase subunit 3